MYSGSPLVPYAHTPMQGLQTHGVAASQRDCLVLCTIARAGGRRERVGFS